MFKTIAAMQKTGVIATVELYEPQYEEPDLVLFLTKTGVLRKPTKSGNRKITTEKAIELTGKSGLGWLHELHKEQQGNKHLDRTFGEYEVDLCQDLDVYCEEEVDEFEPYQITDLDMDIAEDLHFKELNKAN